MAVSGPTVVRRQLGRRLARLREQAEITHAQVGAALGLSRASMYRLEAGQIEIKIPIVRALCREYGVPDDETEALVSLATGTKAQGWWQEYADVTPEWFKLYVGLESGAARICAWDDSLVPGILQTPDYAAAVFREGAVDGQVSVERRVRMRMERKERVLSRDPTPTITAVIGEGALTRHVGGRAAMARQRAHLCELAERPNIKVMLLPFAAGAHQAMTGAFTVLDFDDDDDPNLVYVETLTGGRYLERPDELSRYRAAWETITERSIPIGEYQ